jgi:hypothetical protein
LFLFLIERMRLSLSPHPQLSVIAPPLPLHDVAKILKYAAEALVEEAKLDRFAAVESNTLRIFPEAHQAEPEVGLEALPVNIQRHQRSTDFDREPSTDTGVE